MQLYSDTNIKDDLGGAMSVRFKPGKSLLHYYATHIDNYDPERFEVLAIRFYYGKEINITLYAVDVEKQRIENDPGGKVPVKKFKLAVAFLQDILPYIEECNFTLTTGIHPLEAMKVMNK